MPTYEYACEKCDHRFDIFQSMRDDHLVTCPECNQDALRRVIGAGAGLIFKGTGFYQTDYKNTGSDKSGSDSESSAKPNGDSGSGSATDKKPASASSDSSSNDTKSSNNAKTS